MKVTLVDYSVNNILNVYRAFEYLGVDVQITNLPSQIKKADYLVLPGVGAFHAGMSSLQKLDLIEPVLQHANVGKPLLGICLGMQMLLDSSQEFGFHNGLGLIGGTNEPIIPKNSRKSTHIGWSELETLDGSAAWDHNNILSGINVRTPMYFVHSFVARLTDPKCLLAQTGYYDVKISAVIMKENIYGCQFHPEKSGPYGLKVLLNFLNI